MLRILVRRRHMRLSRSVCEKFSLRAPPVGKDALGQSAVNPRYPVVVRERCSLLWWHCRLKVLNLDRFFLHRFMSTPCRYFARKIQHTSPTPRSAHHSASVPCKSSPRTRKSKGTGCGRFRTRLISWLSWNRRQPVGSMYCCEGIAYSVRVVKTTGCCVVVVVVVVVVAILRSG